MPEYLSPGVYVEEVPSAIKPIAGVSTSTAGFIGTIPDSIQMPPSEAVKSETVGKGDAKLKTSFDLAKYPAVTDPGTFQIRVGGTVKSSTTLVNDDANKKSRVIFDEADAPAKGLAITADYRTQASPPEDVKGEAVGSGEETSKLKASFDLANYPVVTDAGTFLVRVGDAVNGNAKLVNDEANKKSRVVFEETDPPAKNAAISADYFKKPDAFKPIAAGQVKLCTNFTEYKKSFGDFSFDADQRNLAHAVYGFFNNGGSRCYVVRVADSSTVDKALEALERVDEIAIVGAPGITDAAVRDKVVIHCKKMGNRFAIFDGPGSPVQDLTAKLTKTPADGGIAPKNTDYAAWYFPWIKVANPIPQYVQGQADRSVAVPPSGHIAGIYARVDTERGVHKAPANEPILGALDVAQPLSKAEQDLLNPKGVNCIRVLNNNIMVWGARTIGGDSNTDRKYVNVRRTLLFLRDSIDKGTQWVVFEPNTPALWQKITRNVTAFLTNVWRSGALFGNTPQEAFYVKCDAETNPKEARDLGQVVTEVGVAIARPAEFVIFRISQWGGPGK